MAPTTKPTEAAEPVTAPLDLQDCSLEQRLIENSPCWSLDAEINQKYDEKEKEDEAQAEAVVEAVSAGFSPWWWVLGFFILVVFVLFMFFMRNAMVWGQGRHARR